MSLPKYEDQVIDMLNAYEGCDVPLKYIFCLKSFVLYEDIYCLLHTPVFYS